MIDKGVDTLTYAHARGDDRLAVHTLRCMRILMSAAAYYFFDVLSFVYVTLLIPGMINLVNLII